MSYVFISADGKVSERHRDRARYQAALIETFNDLNWNQIIHSLPEIRHQMRVERIKSIFAQAKNRQHAHKVARGLPA